MPISGSAIGSSELSISADASFKPAVVRFAIESALRRFKRKVMTEEIIKDAKKHAFFIPPGQKAKLKSALARKRNKKKGRMRIPRD